MEKEYKVESGHFIVDFMADKALSFVYKYASDWIYLMEVVYKIEEIEDEKYGRFVVYISSNSCSIQSTKQHPIHLLPLYMSDPNAILNTKLESTYYNVVEFIKWYSQHK